MAYGMKLGFICRNTSAHFKPCCVSLRRSRFPDFVGDLNSREGHKCERPSKSPMSTPSNSSIAIRSRTRSCGRRGKVKSAQASLTFIRGATQARGNNRRERKERKRNAEVEAHHRRI